MKTELNARVSFGWDLARSTCISSNAVRRLTKRRDCAPKHPFLSLSQCRSLRPCPRHRYWATLPQSEPVKSALNRARTPQRDHFLSVRPRGIWQALCWVGSLLEPGRRGLLSFHMFHSNWTISHCSENP